MTSIPWSYVSFKLLGQPAWDSWQALKSIFKYKSQLYKIFAILPTYYPIYFSTIKYTGQLSNVYTISKYIGWFSNIFANPIVINSEASEKNLIGGGGLINAMFFLLTQLDYLSWVFLQLVTTWCPQLFHFNSVSTNLLPVSVFYKLSLCYYFWLKRDFRAERISFCTNFTRYCRNRS